MIQAASRVTQSQKLIAQENQQQKKLKTLFYVKSKHTRKQFKNHPYFRTTTQINPKQQNLSQSLQTLHKPQRRSLINQKRLKTSSHHELHQQNLISSNNQFVNYPTQFGLENTYNYLREKSFIAKFESESRLKSSRRVGGRSPSLDRKIQTQGNEEEGRGKNYMKITASYESKFYDTMKMSEKEEVKARSVSGYQQRFAKGLEARFKRKPLPIFRLMEKRNSISINNQPQLSQSKPTSNNNISTNINRNIIYNTPILKNSTIKSSPHSHTPASHKIQFIYAKRLKSVAQIPYRTITFDIFPSIITTFLKCKIHYSQMTQAEYDFVNEAMVKVLESKRKPQKYDIKDIINIGSVREVMKFLQQFKGEQKDFQWLETVRYFFLMKDQKVLDYHMNKLKQQVAQLIAIKFDVQFGQKDLVVYDLDKRIKVETIYDLVKGKRFLISDSEKVLEEYLDVKNEQFEKQTLQTKIKKWKSIADCSEGVENGDLETSKVSKVQSKSVKSSVTPVLCPAKKLSEEKFKNIFEQFKIRQKKRLSKHYSASGTNSVSHSLQSSFIERSKLKREQDFFQ